MTPPPRKAKKFDLLILLFVASKSYIKIQAFHYFAKPELFVLEKIYLYFFTHCPIFSELASMVWGENLLFFVETPFQSNTLFVNTSFQTNTLLVKTSFQKNILFVNISFQTNKFFVNISDKNMERLLSDIPSAVCVKVEDSFYKVISEISTRIFSALHFFHSKKKLYH